MDYKQLYIQELKENAKLIEENKILKDKSKGFKALFREVKKLREELDDINWLLSKVSVGQESYLEYKRKQLRVRKEDKLKRENEKLKV